MNRFDQTLYLEDIVAVARLPLPWNRLKGRRLLVSGATGMVGTFLLDVLAWRNGETQLDCKVTALTRNKERAQARAVPAWESCVRFLECDVNHCIPALDGTVDYVIHAASNTHPVAYATDPIGTITTNIIGTRNMLEAAAESGASRVVFVSSVEIYGENRGDCERFDEQYCGYLDCNTLRAGYPEGKRAGEALCQAYIRQKGLDIVIPRLPRIYGPTMLESDTKAISQFIKKGVAGEDIVLKSAGNQLYSYSCVADAVSGILYCLFFGRNGEAYNVADPGSDVTLKQLAEMIAAYFGKQVVFKLPDAVEQAGYSKATKALMDGQKLKQLGWSASCEIVDGLPRCLKTMQALRSSS